MEVIPCPMLAVPTRTVSLNEPALSRERERELAERYIKVEVNSQREQRDKQTASTAL